MTDLEQSMKAALDGKFYSFVNDNFGELKVVVKEVRPDYSPNYNSINKFFDAGSRGGQVRAAKHAAKMATFWTKAKTNELKRLRALDHSAIRIGRLLGTSRTEIAIKLNKLGFTSTRGTPYGKG